MKLKRFELKILRFLQDLFPNSFWIHLNQGMSFLGDGGLIWFLTMIVLWFIPNYRHLSKLMFVTIAIQALVVNVMLKPVFKRTRPFYNERSRLLLRKEPKDSSFPSAHSSSSFSMAGLMIFIGVSFVILSTKYHTAPTFACTSSLTFEKGYTKHDCKCSLIHHPIPIFLSPIHY